MHPPRPVLVADTSVLIHMHDAGALPQFFGLPYRMVAPEPIVAELRVPPAHTVLGLGLESRRLEPQHVVEVDRLNQQYIKASRNDLTALVLARALGASLLTTDKALSTAATREQVQVRGTLWVFDELVQHQVVRPGQAQTMLQQLLQRSTFPAAEVQQRLSQWQALEQQRTQDPEHGLGL